MRITLKLFANLRKYLPVEAQNGLVELDLPADATAADLIENFRLPTKLVKLVLLNGHFIPPEQFTTTHLSEGDVLAVWPPIAGG